MGYDFRRNLDLECDKGNNTYVTDLFTAEAERIIMQNSGSKPLFLLVTHLAVHTANEEDPLQAPEEEIEKFSYIKDVRRRKYAGTVIVLIFAKNGNFLLEWKFLAIVSKLDESVGRIVYALERANKLNNTIIIFYSDNGAPTVGLFSNTGSNWPLRGVCMRISIRKIRIYKILCSSNSKKILLGKEVHVFRVPYGPLCYKIKVQYFNNLCMSQIGLLLLQRLLIFP